MYVHSSLIVWAFAGREGRSSPVHNGPAAARHDVHSSLPALQPYQAADSVHGRDAGGESAAAVAAAALPNIYTQGLQGDVERFGMPCIKRKHSDEEEGPVGPVHLPEQRLHKQPVHIPQQVRLPWALLQMFCSHTTAWRCSVFLLIDTTTCNRGARSRVSTLSRMEQVMHLRKILQALQQSVRGRITCRMLSTKIMKLKQSAATLCWHNSRRFTTSSTGGSAS